MSFSRPIPWYHSHADPIWPDGTLQGNVPCDFLLQIFFMNHLPPSP